MAESKVVPMAEKLVGGKVAWLVADLVVLKDVQKAGLSVAM